MTHITSLKHMKRLGYTRPVVLAARQGLVDLLARRKAELTPPPLQVFDRVVFPEGYDKGYVNVPAAMTGEVVEAPNSAIVKVRLDRSLVKMTRADHRPGFASEFVETSARIRQIIVPQRMLALLPGDRL